MRTVLLIAALLGAGCPGRSVVTVLPDGGVTDGGGSTDAGAVDGGVTDGGHAADAGTCVPLDWHLENRPIESATPLFPQPSMLGTTEQLDVVVRLNPCELLSNIHDVGYSGNATDFVGLVAEAWTSSACDRVDGVALVHRTFQITTRGNFRVVVADRGLESGGQLVTFEREQCTGSSDCNCWSTATQGAGAEGTTCRTDCSCAAGLSCLCATGVATADPCVCARPCADFLDCASHEICGGAVQACASGSSCPTGHCPDGYVCQQNDPGANACVDRRGPAGGTCQCDADCGPGELCLASGETHVCRIPCWRDADCPANHGLACIGSVCQLLE